MAGQGKTKGKHEKIGFCLESQIAGDAPIPIRSLVGLGRAPGNEIQFPESEATISTYHASVYPKDGRVYLKDLNSANGTWMNETKITECELQEGQEFSLGRQGPRFKLARRALPKPQSLGTILLGDATRAYVRSMGSSQGTMGGWTQFDPVKQKKILLWFRQRNRKQKRLAKILSAFVVLFAGLSLWLFLQVRDLKAQVALHKSLVEQLVPNMAPEKRHEAVLRIRAQEKELAGMRNKLRDYAIKGIYSDGLAVKLHLAAESFGEEGFVLPDGFVEAAKKHYDELMSAYGRKKMTQALARKHGYEELITEELRAAGLPPSLIYLAMHESRFDAKITSPTGARGLWQLMPALAGQYNLPVPDNWRTLPPEKDPRTHPDQATKAGVKFLGRLFGQYHDPFLAMAAYNSGEPQLNSALRKLKQAPAQEKTDDKFFETQDETSTREASATEASIVDEAIAHVTDIRFRSDYWYLQRMNLLPEETIQYVPKIVATMVAAQELGG